MTTTTLILPVGGNEVIGTCLRDQLGFRLGRIETRTFPDGESWLKVLSDPADAEVLLICSMDRPDSKFLPLVFAADAVREMGAVRVGLVAPYLAYMRQDRRFQEGEAVSSLSFARLISGSFDWLVTIDPHLHRYHTLSDLYAIPTAVQHAAPLLADWIAENVGDPVLIGPDAESTQWVSETAARLGAPFTVMQKTRMGDREVVIRLRESEHVCGRTPVILDDIVSSGETMLAAIRATRAVTGLPAVIVTVHGLFAEHAYERLVAEGAAVVTCNTIAHNSNRIDVSPLLASGVTELLSRY